jgi:hypothetical protein
MLPRIATGAGVSALPGAAAITGAAAGWNPWIVGGFALVVAMIWIGALAPFLRGLNRLPVVGSPRMEVAIRLNGRRGMRITVREWAQTCVLEFEVTNLERWTAVTEAWLNVYIPSGIRMGRCEKVGRDQRGGRWDAFHRHQLGTHSRADRWSDDAWAFAPSAGRLIRFKLRFPPAAGEYPVLLKLGAPSLYRPLQATGTIVVGEDGERNADDQMGELITRGEQVEREYGGPQILIGDQERSMQLAAHAFFAKANPLLEKLIGDDPLPQTPENADATETMDQVRTFLDALYVVRDERGRNI